jgi:hypothetical protein
MPRKSPGKSADENAEKGRESRDIVPRAALRSHEMPSNAELKQLIEATKIRLENWTLEVERDPNPRLVHTLKNILGHINEFTRLTDAKVEYSYKGLSRQMSILLREVATLNTAIMESLMDDDLVTAAEEERINETLRRVVQAAVELIRIVQQAFIARQRPQVSHPRTASDNR